jgi:hypothetical protein
MANSSNFFRNFTFLSLSLSLSLSLKIFWNEIFLNFNISVMLIGIFHSFRKFLPSKRKPKPTPMHKNFKLQIV